MNVLQGRGSLGEYEEGLQQAIVVQSQVLEGVRGDHPDLVAAHKQAAADMQTELASLYASQHKSVQVRAHCLSVCLCLFLCLCLSVCLYLIMSACSNTTVCLNLTCHYLCRGLILLCP